MELSEAPQRPAPPSGIEPPQRLQYLIGTIVAVALVALSLANGGYALEFRAAVTVLIWAAVAIGIISGALPRADVPRPALVAGCALGALALLAGLSIAWATDDGRAFLEAVRVTGYLGLFTLIVCASGGEGARPWLIGLALGVLVVGALALTSRLLPALPGGDDEIAASLPNAAGRLSFPIGYWNALAALLAIGVVLFSWLSVHASRVPERALATGAIPVLGVALYFTSSRGGVAAAMVGSLVLLVMGPRRLQTLAGLALGCIGAGPAILLASRRPELLDGLTDDTARTQGAEVLGLLLASVLAIVILRAILDAPLSGVRVATRWARAWVAAAGVALAIGIVVADPGERFEEFKEVPSEQGATESGFVASHLANGSGSGRYQFWGEALDAYASEPLHGIGAGGYEAYWSEHAPIARAIRDAHSVFLEILAELGVVGLLALLTFLAIGPFVTLRRPSMPPPPDARLCVAILATGVTSAAIEWTWEVPAAFLPVVLAVALLTGPALARVRSPGARSTEAGLRRFGWGVAVIAVAWVCAVAAADAFLTEQSLTRSRSAVAEGDLEAAADRARDAIALQPWAAEPRLQLALVQESGNELDDARASVVQASERAPRDWRVWLARARIETRAGEIDQALSSLERARRLNPRNPLFAPLAPP